MQTTVLLLLLIAGFSSGLRFGNPTHRSSHQHERLGIYNGSYTTIARFPFMASLNLDGDLFGAGVILNKEWILTTASNVWGFDPSDLTFRVGTNMINNNSFGQVYEVEKFIMHESFSFSSYNSDIAVVKLLEPMTFGKKLRNATLATVPLEADTKAKVLGWGETETTDFSQFLLHTKVTVMNRTACANATYSLQSTQFCTFDANAGPCQDDYGGPLVANGGIVYGLFSYSEDCTPGHYPILYTDVTQFLDWIWETIASN